jgi:GNAT superfamily N-acetyltransferase
MYQEGSGSTFTHNGKEYPLDPFLKRAAKLPVKQLYISKLKWNLDGLTLDPVRVAEADPSVPILFTMDPKWGYVIIDGTHRLAKAVQEKRYSIPGREIPFSWFAEVGTVSMEDDSNPTYTVGKVTREQAFEWLSKYDQRRPEFPVQPGSVDGEERVYAFAWHGDEVVGYACLLNGQRYLIDMFVPESLRGKGVGRQLVDSLLVDLVVVRSHQTDIIAFLKATGFTLENDFVNTKIYRKYHGPKVHAY